MFVIVCLEIINTPLHRIRGLSCIGLTKFPYFLAFWYFLCWHCISQRDYFCGSLFMLSLLSWNCPPTFVLFWGRIALHLSFTAFNLLSFHWTSGFFVLEVSCPKGDTFWPQLLKSLAPHACLDSLTTTRANHSSVLSYILNTVDKTAES